MADLPPTTELEHLNAQRHAARILHRQLARAVEQLDGNQNSRRRQLQAAQWADTSRELIAAAIPLCTGGAELIAYRDGQHDEAGESKANRHQLHNALVRLSRAVGKANGWDWNALQSHRELHGAAHQVLALRAPIYGRRGFTGQWEMLAGMVVRYPDTAPQRAIVCDTLVAKNLSAAFALLRTMRMQIRTWNYPALLLRLPLHKSEEKLARVIANLFGGRITEDGNATVRQDHDVSEPWAGASPEIIYQISAFHPGGDPFLHPALDTDAECWRAD